MVQQRDDVVLLDAAILVAARRSGRPAATSPTSPTRSSTARNCKQRFRLDQLDDPNACPNCGAQGHASPRPAQFNLMFKTHAGPVEDAGAVAYLRPETAQGMFVNFANVLQTQPQEAAVRHRPGRQVASATRSRRGNFIFRTREFEQMEMEFFVPPADGAAVVRVLVRRAAATGTSTSASRADMLRLRPHDADELSHYSAGHVRRRVPLPVGLGRARGHRQPHRLRPHPARQALGREARLLRPGDQRALRAVRHRAGGRRHPHDDGVPARRLRRGRGQRRGAHRAAPAPAPRAVQGGGAAAVEEGHAHAARPRGARARCSQRYMSTTTRRRRSAGATAARTRSARRCASPSTSTRSTTARSPSATATRRSRCGCRSTRSSASSRAASPVLGRVLRPCSSVEEAPGSGHEREAGDHRHECRNEQRLGVTARRRKTWHRGGRGGRRRRCRQRVGAPPGSSMRSVAQLSSPARSSSSSPARSMSSWTRHSAPSSAS